MFVEHPSYGAAARRKVAVCIPALLHMTAICVISDEVAMVRIISERKNIFAISSTVYNFAVPLESALTIT